MGKTVIGHVNAQKILLLNNRIEENVIYAIKKVIGQENAQKIKTNKKYHVINVVNQTTMLEVVIKEDRIIRVDIIQTCLVLAIGETQQA